MERIRPWSSPPALVGISCAGVALASALAASMVLRTWGEVQVTQRVQDLLLAIRQAGRLSIAAAGIAIVVALIAAVVALRSKTRRPTQVPALVFALGAGIAPVLLFRRSIDFLMREITPGTNTLGGASLVQAIERHLTITAIISAACCVAAVAIVATTLRSVTTHIPND